MSQLRLVNSEKNKFRAEIDAYREASEYWERLAMGAGFAERTVDVDLKAMLKFIEEKAPPEYRNRLLAMQLGTIDSRVEALIDTKREIVARHFEGDEEKLLRAGRI